MFQRNIIYILVGLILMFSSWKQWRIMHKQVYEPSVSNYSSGKNLGASQQVHQICYNNHCWELEIADSDEERKQGLMHRTVLGQNSGMLFQFPSAGVYPFWMKNTIIPLDIIWLNASGVVVEMSSANPCLFTGSQANNCPLYGGRTLATYVLEINQGMIEKFGIKTGSVMILKL